MACCASLRLIGENRALAQNALIGAETAIRRQSGALPKESLSFIARAGTEQIGDDRRGNVGIWLWFTDVAAGVSIRRAPQRARARLSSLALRLFPCSSWHPREARPGAWP